MKQRKVTAQREYSRRMKRFRWAVRRMHEWLGGQRNMPAKAEQMLVAAGHLSRRPTLTLEKYYTGLEAVK